MDYIEIILRGYVNENDRQFLSKYFIRESKKAEKEHYSFEEFFTGLDNAISKFRIECKNRFYKRKNELHSMQELAKNGTLNYPDLKGESIEERNKKTIEYCESELSEISFENYPINLFHFTNDRYRGNLYHSEVVFIESEISKAHSKLIEAKKIKTSSKAQRKIKGLLTNETYYDVLEKCTIEAFECLKLKDHYPKDGTKAIWDISSLTITKGDGLPTEKDNELFRNEYIKDNMRNTFLLAIERYSEDFQKKHSISRSVFYKKCYQSLLFKISESPLWSKPDFGIDIDNPCLLTFIWNMRGDIEARSIEPQQDTNIYKYIKSCDLDSFAESANKRKADGSKNDFYQGETFITWLHNSNLRVEQYKEPLIQKKEELINFNYKLHTLVNDITHLYRQIRFYKLDSSVGKTGIYLEQEKVLKTLKDIEFYSKKVKYYVLDSERECAILFKNYCVEKFEEIIFNIEDILFIRAYDSPLKENFEKAKEILQNSINLEELKIISNLSTVTPEVSQQVEKTKPKKLKKVLFQFIHNIDDKEGFIQELKESFPTEKGKSIKAIIDILTEQKILVYGTKEFKTLYEEIKLSFNRDIGTYNSIQNVKVVDKETTSTVHEKLNPLTIKYKIP